MLLFPLGHNRLVPRGNGNCSLSVKHFRPCGILAVSAGVCVVPSAHAVRDTTLCGQSTRQGMHFLKLSTYFTQSVHTGKRSTAALRPGRTQYKTLGRTRPPSSMGSKTVPSRCVQQEYRTLQWCMRGIGESPHPPTFFCMQLVRKRLESCCNTKLVNECCVVEESQHQLIVFA